jgi:hypothetical protein
MEYSNLFNDKRVLSQGSCIIKIALVHKSMFGDNTYAISLRDDAKALLDNNARDASQLIRSQFKHDVNIILQDNGELTIKAPSDDIDNIILDSPDSWKYPVSILRPVIVDDETGDEAHPKSTDMPFIASLTGVSNQVTIIGTDSRIGVDAKYDNALDEFAHMNYQRIFGTNADAHGNDIVLDGPYAYDELRRQVDYGFHVSWYGQSEYPFNEGLIYNAQYLPDQYLPIADFKSLVYDNYVSPIHMVIYELPMDRNHTIIGEPRLALNAVKNPSDAKSDIITTVQNRFTCDYHDIRKKLDTVMASLDANLKAMDDTTIPAAIRPYYQDNQERISDTINAIKQDIMVLDNEMGTSGPIPVTTLRKLIPVVKELCYKACDTEMAMMRNTKLVTSWVAVPSIDDIDFDANVRELMSIQKNYVDTGRLMEHDGVS